MEGLAIAVAFVLTAVAIYLMPDRFKPWWEQPRRDIQQDRLMPMRLIRATGSAMDWPINAIVRHLEKRLYELSMSIIMISVGVLLFFSPASLEASSMKYLLDVMSVWTCATIFIVFGLARIVALALNGHWMPGGAYVRASGAAVGALIWGQWAAALFELHLKTGSPISPGVPVYAILAFFEAISYFRALNGVVGNGRILEVGAGDHQRVAPDPRAQPYRVHRRDNPAHRAGAKSLPFPQI